MKKEIHLIHFAKILSQLEKGLILYLFTAYQKKKSFGPGEITGENLQVTDTEKIHLVQIGSVVEIDGQTLPAIPLNVEKLYAEEPSRP